VAAVLGQRLHGYEMRQANLLRWRKSDRKRGTSP
jgi:hypothetical protein